MSAKKFGMAALAAVSVLTLLSGCGPEGETGDIVILDTEERNLNYTLAAASIEDIVVSESVNCVYQQVNDEELSFSISGKTISNVYVKEGDSVKKGDLVAELASAGTADADIETLEYQIARNKLLLEQAKSDMDLEIRIKKQEFATAKQPAEDSNALTREIAAIQRRYQYQISTYEDDNAVKEMNLKKLKEEMESCFLYAGMDGKVSYVKQGLQGSTSQKGTTVIRVIDDTQCIFVSKKNDFKELFEKDKVYNFSVLFGAAQGDYELVPYQMDEWGEQMYFTFAPGTDAGELTVGTSGDVILVRERKEQVLTVPQRAIHKADDKAFVYVIGDNQVREVQWITIGLEGTDIVEVTDGLAEGDKVILK